MKLTGTNRPITYTTHHLDKPILQKRFARQGWYKDNKTACVHYVVPKQQTRTAALLFQGTKPQHNNNTTVVTPQISHHRDPHTRVPAGTGARVTAVIAWGKRPVPFRTRKLRPTAPMVLHPGGCGRVGHRRNIIKRSRAPTTRLGLSRI